MEYDTYWSILDTPSQTLQPNVICLWGAACAALLWFLVKKLVPDGADSGKPLFLRLLGIFAVLGLAGGLLTSRYPDHSRERTAALLDSPNACRVEGIISDFQRSFRYVTPRDSVTIETWMVGGIRFCYEDAALGRFNSFTHTKTGVLFSGQRVRVTYRPDTVGVADCHAILLLEIARQASE